MMTVKDMPLRLFSICFLFISLIAVASATDTYQQNKAFSYNKPCTDFNGNFCGSDYTCTLTIESSKKIIVVNNGTMTKNGTFYNYTIAAQQPMGIYDKIMSCNNGTNAGTNTEAIEITADGLPYRQVPILYIVVLVALLLLVFDQYLNKRFQTKGFTIFGASLLLIAGILILYPGFNYTNWSTLEGLAGGSILIGLGGIILSGQLEDLL